jgi:hypothetical protein
MWSHLPRIVSLFLLCVSSIDAQPLQNGVIDRTFSPRAIVKSTVETNQGGVMFDLNKAALIIIDMQVFFLKDKDAPGLALIPQMNKTIAAFRQAGAPVVWVNWGVRKDMRNFPGQWQPPIHGAPDAEIYPTLDVDKVKLKKKGRYK